MDDSRTSTTADSGYCKVTKAGDQETLERIIGLIIMGFYNNGLFGLAAKKLD